MNQSPESTPASNEQAQSSHTTARIRQAVARGALAFVTAVVPVTAELVSPVEASATTAFANDYPDTDAWDCSATFGIYAWCKGSPATYMSPRGYVYRNCVDGASYWTKKYTGYDPKGWHNAKDWDDNAQGKTGVTVKDGTSNAIEPGDIAQSDIGDYGHVGFVTDVTKDTSGNVTTIKVADLNGDTHGNYNFATVNRTPGTKFVEYGNVYWDHFIDVNGQGLGLNNEAWNSGGGSMTRPISGDFNGDHITDSAIFRPSDGYWHIRGVGDYLFGQAGDIPVPADYNGDGITDIAVFRPSQLVNGEVAWHIRGVGDFYFGHPGDIPVPGDYNADGKAEIAIYRPSELVNGEAAWHIRAVGDYYYGHSGDIPVPGYYNNDASLDIAVYRPSEGGWHVRAVGDWPYGWSTDIPAIQTLSAYLLKQYGLIAAY